MVSDTTTTIEVKDETWQQLKMRKGRGESFDDIIQDLLELSRVELPDKPLEADYHRPELIGVEVAEEEECVRADLVNGETCGEDAHIVMVHEGPTEDSEPYRWPMCEKHQPIGELPEEMIPDKLKQ